MGELTVSSFRGSAGHRPSTRVQDTRTLSTGLLPPVNSIAPVHLRGRATGVFFDAAVHLSAVQGNSSAEHLVETPFLGSFWLCYRLPCEFTHHTPTYTPKIASYLGGIINSTHLEQEHEREHAERWKPAQAEPG